MKQNHYVILKKCKLGTAKGDTNSYKTSDYQSKNIHFTLLDQLLPGNTYFYVCGDDVENVKSAEFSFRMPDYEHHTGSIAIVGDLGQTCKMILKMKKC